MPDDRHLHLSRRERQIMQALFEKEAASAQEVRLMLPSPPSYSAVRAMLSKLETKGVIYHKEQGAKYIYYPVAEKNEASKSAIKRLMNTFFDASPLATVNALLGMQESKLSEDEISELEKIVEDLKKRSGE